MPAGSAKTLPKQRFLAGLRVRRIGDSPRPLTFTATVGSGRRLVPRTEHEKRLFYDDSEAHLAGRARSTASLGADRCPTASPSRHPPALSPPGDSAHLPHQPATAKPCLTCHSSATRHPAKPRKWYVPKPRSTLSDKSRLIIMEMRQEHVLTTPACESEKGSQRFG